MTLLILCGTSRSGKSKTVRFSVRHLNQDKKIVRKFENEAHHNPPKKIIVNGVPVWIYICSPQELSRNVDECLKKFKTRLEKDESNALVILTFNFDPFYADYIRSCLAEINKRKLKESTYFVLLDASNVQEIPDYSNTFAKDLFSTLKNKSYKTLKPIKRFDDNWIQRGEKFSKYIKQLLSAE